MEETHPNVPGGALALLGHFTSLPTGKTVLMLSMCGLSFEYREVALFEHEHHGADFGRINPVRQVPVLFHGDRTIVQSAVILRYLSALSGKYGGRDETEERHILEWLFFDADMVASIRFPRTLTKIFDGRKPEVVEFHRQRGYQALEVLDTTLAERPFVAGDAATIADIAIFPVVDNAADAGIDSSAFDNVSAWLSHMRSLPGCANHYELMARFTTVDMQKTPASIAAMKKEQVTGD